MAYTGLVQPALEYVSSVWDPYLNKYILSIEKVQRREARWAKSDYHWNSSVTAMLCNLQWPTLSCRREVSRLKTFIMPSTITQLLKSHTISWQLLMPQATSIHYILWLPPYEQMLNKNTLAVKKCKAKKKKHCKWLATYVTKSLDINWGQEIIYQNLLSCLNDNRKKYVAKDVINEILYIHPFSVA